MKIFALPLPVLS